MQPGEQLGLDVEISPTNIIQFIDAGLVADLNKVYPGSVEVGDRILEVFFKFPEYSQVPAMISADLDRFWKCSHRKRTTPYTGAQKGGNNR